jgi:hypothetical protein
MTRTIDGLIEAAVAKVIAERPQLGPFASSLRTCRTVNYRKQILDPEKVAELDDEKFAARVADLKSELDVEADELERDLDNSALLVLLVGTPFRGPEVPYPEASSMWGILARLDQADIEPACKAFLERVNFHRMMREMGQ